MAYYNFMQNICVSIEEPILCSNKILVKSICFLWLTQAHDMLFVPSANKITIKVKGYNSCVTLSEIPISELKNLQMNIKLACGLNIIDQIPQSCTFTVIIDNNRYSIRSSFHPSNFGETLSLRIIRGHLFDKLFNAITIQDENHSFNMNELMSNIYKTKGLVLIGGSTCSGKSTLLYTIINSFEGHIITLEDPIEYELPHIVQTEVMDLGYLDGVKSALRQNPDCIVIGEVRDHNSAQAAIRASLTGHLVLTTIHATAPEQILARFLELNCEYIGQCVSLVIFCDNFQYYLFKFKNNKLITN